jgi:hypothetical protein
MKQRFRLYRRGKSERYYIHDDLTGKQESLHTNDRPAATLAAKAPPRKQTSK